MDTKDFEYLVEIARQESLSKAAARLYLSQPTLTKFLKKIEAEYGTPLFDRVGKKMVLTEAGRCCVQKSEQILALNRPPICRSQSKSRGSYELYPPQKVRKVLTCLSSQ